MENAVKALEIAAGVLLAVIILSLITYFFSTLSEWPSQEDTMETSEQLAKFNLEYEVYEKKAMYGVDVISCLNKAKSNNEKYVEEGAFLSGTRYGDDYVIDVCVRINGPLSEVIEIYYLDETTNTQQRRGSESASTIPPATHNEDELSSLGIDLIGSGSYTKFKPEDKLFSDDNDLDGANHMIENGGSKEFESKKYYSIISDKEIIEGLLDFSTKNPKITVKNTDSSTLRYWSTAVWETALYNFKTRKFKCDSIQYSEKTGRVNAIYFSELGEEDG